MTLINYLPGYPTSNRGYTQIVPFTYADGLTYLETLEALRVWIATVLVPSLDDEYDALSDNWLQQVLKIQKSFNDAILAFPSSGRALLAGTNIDPTGVADSTAAVNAFFAAKAPGETVVVPAGSVIRMTGQLVLPNRVRIHGSGELRWTAGVTGQAAMSVNADGSVIDSITLTNAGNTPVQSGNNKQYGIWIAGSNVKVTNVTVDGFQQGISVSPFGEYYRAIIVGNHVLNVPGSGDGPANVTSNQGEDRGDGITVWGAASVVTGNTVTAAAGTDARIGIHAEGLPNLEAVPGAHSSSMTVIANNVVEGKFRRGIVSEYVASTVIEGNTVADATWWGIALIGGTGSSLKGNTINWTRPASDGQGVAWTPRRCAIMVYGTGSNTTVEGNTLNVASTANIPYGICVQTSGNGNRNFIKIAGNMLNDDSKTMQIGVYLDGSQGVIYHAQVDGNTVSGYTSKGVYGYATAEIDVSRNTIVGPTAQNANGVHLESSATGAIVDSNKIFYADTCIKIYSRNASTKAQNNLLFGASVGVDYYGTPALAGAISNITNNVTTPAKNA